ncbi:MAG: ThuA domain-containing protein [Verrucomicrobia bacterium]|nr:ThuA domain-containing protein [Verrucomicrobiota bacterium]
MKTLSLVTPKSLMAAVLAAGLVFTAAAQAPKKIMVVTTTTGFRHSSIPTAEKILAKLGQQSGAFTVEYVQQPVQTVKEPRKPKAPAATASDAAKAKYQTELATYEADNAKFKEAQKGFMDEMKKTLEKLSPANLKNFDGVIFANTTGDLPIPDRDGFLDWLKSGKAFIGMHACSDTFHGWPAFIKMLGGEFAGHGAQVGVECLNQDTKHPANANLGPSWKISLEEMYLIKNHDSKECQELLLLDKHPNKPEQAGQFPVSWCKSYGQGKVFYTSLGHREDIWDDETPPDFKRANSKEISLAYQKHILGGIKWALGMADAKP